MYPAIKPDRHLPLSFYRRMAQKSFDNELLWKAVVENNIYDLPDAFNVDDFILDIGAGMGEFCFTCVRRGCGNISAYEVSPSSFSNLEMNYFKFALSEYVTISPYPVFIKKGRNKIPIQLAYKNKREKFKFDKSGSEWVFLDFDSITDAYKSIRLLRFNYYGNEIPILLRTKNLDKIRELILHISDKNVFDKYRPVTNRLKDFGFHITYSFHSDYNIIFGRKQ